MKVPVDFHRDSMQGQMKPGERKAMYDMVMTYKPKTMLEIGTWKGGGSTYILSSAASEYGGVLHTIEADAALQQLAVRLYEAALVHLRPYVIFHVGFSHVVIPELLKTNTFDFVLFDGAEDADQTVREYDLLNKQLGLGSIIACHDWSISKQSKLRAIIANDNSWVNIVWLPNTDTGFAMFRRTV